LLTRITFSKRYKPLGSLFALTLTLNLIFLQTGYCEYSDVYTYVCTVYTQSYIVQLGRCCFSLAVGV
jgi:hypothetical protein